jgi:signal transduction histidine kinase
MFRSLSAKLILAFLAVTATTTILFAVFAVWATRVRFNEFVLNREQQELTALLTTYYQVNGSWDGIAEIFTPQAGPYQGTMIGPGRGPRGQAGGPNKAENSFLTERRLFTLVDNAGIVVLTGLGFQTGESVPADGHYPDIPLTINGDPIGTLYFRPEDVRNAPVSAGTFLSNVTQAMVLSALVASVFALLLGIILARSLTGPLREMTRATRAMAAGDLDQQVPVHSQDELGELATSFNQMSSDLSRAVSQRRQMTADIAHDLRSPLSIIMGYTEMLRDGILPGDQETYALLHEESKQLSRLVEDLRTLSLADAGELTLLKEPVLPQEILHRAVQVNRHQAEQKGITLQMVASEELPPVEVDLDRIDQVLDNLISNAMRNTPAGGQITLGAERANGAVQLRVADNGEGIAPEHLPHVFDRFYRVDQARSTDSSGLGLAIARSIINLHQGHIQVESEPGRGTAFLIQLPTYQD